VLQKQPAEYQVYRFPLLVAGEEDFRLNGVRSFDLVPGAGAVGQTIFIAVDGGAEIELAILFPMHVQVNPGEPTGHDRRISVVRLRTAGGVAGTITILAGGFEVASA
jgi:hypothetical protein